MLVLIVGAGIGSLVIAQSLQKHNISFEVFERNKDSNARFQGWVIMIDRYERHLPGPNEVRGHSAELEVA